MVPRRSIPLRAFRRPAAARGRPGGFTLVEVAVALLVVAVGFTSVLSIFPVGLQWTRDTLARGSAMQGAATVARAILARDAANPATSSRYRLNRALITGKPATTQVGDSGTNHYTGVFELNGFYYTAEFRVRDDDGSWVSTDWRRFRTSSTALAGDLDGSAAINRRPRLVHVRVTCFRAKPRHSTSSTVEDELPDDADANVVGQLELSEWVVNPQP